MMIALFPPGRCLDGQQSIGLFLASQLDVHSTTKRPPPPGSLVKRFNGAPAFFVYFKPGR